MDTPPARGMTRVLVHLVFERMIDTIGPCFFRKDRLFRFACLHFRGFERLFQSIRVIIFSHDGLLNLSYYIEEKSKPDQPRFFSSNSSVSWSITVPPN